jgi:hypothetical protein
MVHNAYLVPTTFQGQDRGQKQPNIILYFKFEKRPNKNLA